MTYLTMIRGAAGLVIAAILLAAAPLAESANPIVLGYVGARPAGRPDPVNLNNIPTIAGVDTYVALAFAKDNGGANFGYYDGLPYTPAQVAAAKQSNPNLKFMASLGGWTFPWDGITGPASTAAASLGALINTWGLVGIDINYEQFGTTTAADFGTWWCQIFQALRNQFPALIITLCPFSGVDNYYEAVYAVCPSLISWVNYQGYGNAPGWASQTGALQAAASKYGGFGNIAVGLCANDLEQYRGTGSVNDAFALTAWGRNKGTKGAFVWAWEDDQVGSATKGPWGMTGGINWLLSQGAQLLQIRNVHSNTCMAIWDGSNNMQAFMWACNAADHHQWFYWYPGIGLIQSYFLSCLSLYDNTNGANPYTWLPCNSGDQRQLWLISGTVQLASIKSRTGNCLAVWDSSNGIKPFGWTCAQDPLQGWSFNYL